MNDNPNAMPKRVLIIDKQEHWRELSVKALKKAGYDVQTIKSYAYPPSNGSALSRVPDLVILGCASIDTEEQELISRILHRKKRLLVLCTYLSWKVMHTLFLMGADDVADKPYDPDRLVRIVDEAMGRAARRNNYQVMEPNGVP